MLFVDSIRHPNPIMHPQHKLVNMRRTKWSCTAVGENEIKAISKRYQSEMDSRGNLPDCVTWRNLAKPGILKPAEEVGLEEHDHEHGAATPGDGIELGSGSSLKRRSAWPALEPEVVLMSSACRRGEGRCERGVPYVSLSSSASASGSASLPFASPPPALYAAAGAPANACPANTA